MRNKSKIKLAVVAVMYGMPYKVAYTKFGVSKRRVKKCLQKLRSNSAPRTFKVPYNQ